MKDKFSPFDEWMSGRRWLGEKAPKEGFYGRYTAEELELLKNGYLQGWDCRYIETPPNLNENDAYLFKLAYEVGVMHSPLGGKALAEVVNEK